jgi:hypothetical protein
MFMQSGNRKGLVNTWVPLPIEVVPTHGRMGGSGNRGEGKEKKEEQHKDKTEEKRETQSRGGRSFNDISYTTKCIVVLKLDELT